MALRDYQIESLDSVRRAESEGCINQLIVLPCGCGKTVIASHLPEAMGMQPWQSMLFLCHRNELAEQTMEEFREANPDLSVGLEKAGSHTAGHEDLIVASVQTLSRSPDRVAKLAATNPRIVVVDEGHHLPSNSWSSVVEKLGCLKGSPNRDPSRLFTVITATPRRADGVGLDKFCDKIVFHRSSRRMINEGWLCPPVGFRVSSGESLDGIATRGGDFATGQLEAAVNTPERNALVVKHYIDKANGVPAIAFTVDIAHSEDLAATFRSQGIHFEALSGDTPTQKRRELVEEHRRGNVMGLVSCGVLVEGFNSPIATVGLMARPTQSGLLYQQMAGRVMRPYPAPEAAATHTGYRKAHAILIDFVGVSEKFRLHTASTLFGLNPQFDMEGRSIVKTMEYLEDLQKRFPTLDVTSYSDLAEIEAAAVSVDLWKPAPIPRLAKTCSAFTWIQAAEDVYRLSAIDMAIFIEVNHLNEYLVYRRTNGTTDMQMKFADPEDAFSYADSMVPQEQVILLRAKARWRNEPPSQPQCEHLWYRDPTVKQRFSSGEAFWRFAKYQFEANGNKAFSKGEISMRIERAKRAREKTGGK